MLQNIHDKIKGWFANIVMGILALAFALWGVGFYLERGGSSNEVASVNGTSITENQLNAAYERAKQTIQSHSKTLVSLTPDQQTALKQQVLQQLIQTYAMSDAASKAGLRITNAQLDNLILQIPGFQVNGNFSADQFQRVLNALDYPQDQFIADITRSLLVEQMQLGIQNSVFVLPEETKQIAKLMEQKRDIRYAIIPMARFLPTVKVSDEAINHYYQQHADQFKTPEKVQISYIQLTADHLRKQIKVSDQDLRQYYQENPTSFVKHNQRLPFEAVKNEIAKIITNQKLQQLFSEQSQKLSDLTYTNASSLEPAAQALGLPIQTTDYFTRTGSKTGILANPQVVTTAFNEDVLKENNNSNVIPLSDSDVIVLRVKNYQPEAPLPLAAVKDQISQQLKQQMAQAAAKQEGEKIVHQLQAVKDLSSALTPQYHLNWTTKNDITRQSSGIDPQVLRSAYTLEKAMPDHQAVAGAVLSNGDYALINLLQIKETDTAALTPQQLKVIQHGLENDYGQLDYQLYVQYILNHAKIKKT